MFWKDANDFKSDANRSYLIPFLHQSSVIRLGGAAPNSRGVMPSSVSHFSHSAALLKHGEVRIARKVDSRDKCRCNLIPSPSSHTCVRKSELPVKEATSLSCSRQHMFSKPRTPASPMALIVMAVPPTGRHANAAE